MQPIPLEPGMRVRCVDASPSVGSGYFYLTQGEIYTISLCDDETFIALNGIGASATRFHVSRFKPIIRVKAPTRRVITNGPFACMTESDAIDLVRGGY